MDIVLHPKQSLVFQTTARQVLWGGSAGPGKSFLLRVAGIAWAWAIAGLQVYLFRRTFPDLYRNHMEGPTSLPALLAPWLNGHAVRINYSHNQVQFANGSTIHLAHMQYEKDVSKIQGAEIHVALIDELTHFSKKMYAFIRSRVRMSGIHLPAAYAGLFPRILAASNPGGIGHQFVRRLFVDPAPPGTIWQAPADEGGLSTQFIPALLRDNPTMMLEDPDYEQRLRGLGNPEMVRAMLDGDWNALVGGMFDAVWTPSVHIMAPFVIPKTWRLDRAHDWGSSKPFCTLWFAESNGEAVEVAPGVVRSFPRGTLFMVAEDYGCAPNEENVGIGGTPKLICDRVKAVEAGLGRKALPGPADDPLWDSTRGRAMIDEHIAQGVSWLKPSKGPGSRVTGWNLILERLKASVQSPMEKPGLFVFNRCRHFIRTFPVLPRDEHNLEDVSTEAEDHSADALRLKILSQGVPMQTRRYVA